MSQQEEWTVRRLLEWTTGFFKSRSFDSPRLDAEVLLAFALRCKRIELYTSYDTVPGEEARALFRQLVQRRGRGEPVAYLVGHKEFYSLDFVVDSNVLIPRPETEQLVLEAIEYVKSREQTSPNRVWRICDMGTGSGNIALTIAKNIPQAVVSAVDISEEALRVARENARRLQLTDRVTWYHGDLFSPIPETEQFDLLVSNPPYVSRSEYESLPGTVRDYEPQDALLAGETGLEIVARLATESSSRLVPGGRVFIETSPMIVNAAVDLFQKQPKWHDVTIINDFAGRQRFVAARRTLE